MPVPNRAIATAFLAGFTGPDPPIGIELSHDIDDLAGGDRVTAESLEDLHLLDVSYPDAMAASTGSEAGHPDLPGVQGSPYLVLGTSCSSYGIQISSEARPRNPVHLIVWNFSLPSQDPEHLQRPLRNHPAVTPTAASFAMRASDSRQLPGTVDVVFASSCCRRRRFRILEPSRTAFLTRVLKLGHARLACPLPSDHTRDPERGLTPPDGRVPPLPAPRYISA